MTNEQLDAIYNDLMTFDKDDLVEWLIEKMTEKDYQDYLITMEEENKIANNN